MNSTITRALLLLLCSSIIGTAGKRERTRSRTYKRRSRQLEAVNGGYSDWYLYSLCNLQMCTETWTRYCNSPRPKNGGATCKGDSFKKERCRDRSRCVTKTEAPTDPKVVTETVKSQWSRWGPCSVSCGVGTRTRVMLPCKDTANCETQEQPCLKRSCQLDHGYGDWTEWGTCQNCVQSRTRECERPDICSFKQDEETQRCFDCVLDTETMTECQKILHEHTNFGRTGYQIECTEDGHFAPIQCDKSMGKCWCVNQPTGRQIFGTHHPSHMNGIYNCEKLSTMTHCRALQQVGLMNIVASDYIPQCDEDGNFLPEQYNEEFEIRWCVYSDGLEIPNTRVSINDAVACEPELSKLTKCVATSEADCSDAGTFHSTQCYMEDEWRVCRCVFANGLTKDSTEMTTEIPECSAYPDLTLTKCQALSLVSLTVTCLPSGEFAPEYCSQTVCYCVNRDGSMVPGSSSPVNGQRRTSCEDLIKMHERGNHGLETEKTELFTMGPDATSGVLYSSSGTYEPATDIPVVDPTSASISDYFGMSTTSGGQPADLRFEYNEWSDWSPCSVDCGGGYTSASRSCPMPNNACGGPDIAKKWDACNTMPCLEAVIEVLEYEWSVDSSDVTVTCAAVGLPKPYVVIRNDTGFISEDDQIEYTQENGRILVRYRITPRENTTLTCIATGEGQARKNIEIHVKPAKLYSFTASSPAVYLGQEITLRCSVTGLPRPDIRLLENGVTIEERSSEELVSVLHPTETVEYSCAALYDGEVVDSSPSLAVVVVDPCVGVQCQEHASCEVEADGNTTCTCKTCDEGDIESADPVCASNCHTYLNSCDMERVSCLESVSLYSIYSGSCSQIDPPVVTSTCPEEIVEGNDVLLECSATGLWDTAVWSKDGTIVGRGKRLRLSDISTTDSGIYTCNITGCGGSEETSCTVRVQKKDTEECIQYGAGHFHQFSGASFNYPGVCHYVLAMDCHYGSFYIYTGTSQCGSDEMPLAYASSVTVYVGWDAVVLLRGFDVNEFGVMKHLSPGSEIVYQNFRIWRKRDAMYLTHPATNFTLAWDGLTVVSLTMSKSYAGGLCGLCGDVGVEYNEVEDPQAHASSYEVDRYDQCNVADIPVNTCTSQRQQDDAETACFSALHSEKLSKCHGVINLEEYMETCVYDTCGVKWLKNYHTGLCNVLNAYTMACEDMGVELRGWRDATPCTKEVMHRVSYMSKKRRRRKRDVGLSEFEIMMGGD